MAKEPVQVTMDIKITVVQHLVAVMVLNGLISVMLIAVLMAD